MKGSSMKKLVCIFNIIFGLSLLGCNAREEKIVDSGLPNKLDSFNCESRFVILNSEYKMPIVGLGTWTLRGDVAESCVYHALKCGYRLIDTAQYYSNEREVGRAISRAINDGFVKREDVFVTSKIVPGYFDDVEEEIDKTLERLNMDYIDLMLVHQPGYKDRELYEGLCRAVKRGKIRSVGISNFYTSKDVDRVTQGCDIKPAVVQNENHIFYNDLSLQKYLHNHGAVIESYYPFGGRGNTSKSFGNPVVISLAKKYNKTPAQIILRWHIQSGFVTIPGSSNKQHIEENFDIFDFSLSEEDISKINKLNTGRRFENW